MEKIGTKEDMYIAYVVYVYNMNPINMEIDYSVPPQPIALTESLAVAKLIVESCAVNFAYYVSCEMPMKFYVDGIIKLPFED